jgi:hypothetical protein
MTTLLGFCHEFPRVEYGDRQVSNNVLKELPDAVAADVYAFSRAGDSHQHRSRENRDERSLPVGQDHDLRMPPAFVALLLPDCQYSLRLRRGRRLSTVSAQRHNHLIPVTPTTRPPGE